MYMTTWLSMQTLTGLGFKIPVGQEHVIPQRNVEVLQVPPEINGFIDKLAAQTRHRNDDKRLIARVTRKQ